jgi:hypothetical protein
MCPFQGGAYGRKGGERDVARKSKDTRTTIVSTETDGRDARVRQLADALERAVAASAYVSRGQRISAGSVRGAYRNRRWGDQRWLFFASAKLTTPAGALAEFSAALRPFLVDHLEPETDRVGNGLFSLFGGPGSLATPTIPEFGELLVDGAVKLGAIRVVELLLGWIAGAHLHVRRSAILQGVTIEEPLGLTEGVRLSTLPPSSADLPASLPEFGLSATDLLRGVVLSIDCEVAPSLYAPERRDDRAASRREGTWTPAANKIPSLSLDGFCESMSLACGEYVDWRIAWDDYGDLAAFSLGYGGASTKPRWWVRSTPFAQKDLDRAREIHLARHADGAGGKRKALDQAISRWMKSKQSSADSDRLIELRIALEALYSKGAMNEMAFRVSTYGAWHLGGTVAERRAVRETLRRAYDDASRAIHASDLKHTKRDKQLLPAAQAFCLRGILKRLEESEEPAWDELILGGLPEDHSEERSE